MTQSLLGGHVPISCGAIGNSVALIKEGKIRALGITAKTRLETLPDIPTLDEMGIKDMEAETITGVFAPAGTPMDVVNLLQKEIAAIVKSPDIKARLLELGIVPEGDTPAELCGLCQSRHCQVEAGDRDCERSEDLVFLPQYNSPGLTLRSVGHSSACGSKAAPILRDAGVPRPLLR